MLGYLIVAMQAGAAQVSLGKTCSEVAAPPPSVRFRRGVVISRIPASSNSRSSDDTRRQENVVVRAHDVLFARNLHETFAREHVIDLLLDFVPV
jgi:hypothetical protein